MTKVCRLCLQKLQKGSPYFNVNAVESFTGFMPYRDQLTTCIPEIVRQTHLNSPENCLNRLFIGARSDTESRNMQLLSHGPKERVRVQASLPPGGGENSSLRRAKNQHVRLRERRSNRAGRHRRRNGTPEEELQRTSVRGAAARKAHCHDNQAKQTEKQ